MGRLIALKSLGLRSPETISYWSNILHKEPDAWLRHQALINAFGHYGRQFAPASLDLLATEPSQYMQWQLMQGNIETRQGQGFRSYWDIWIPVTLQFMLVFPDPGHRDKMSVADQEDLLRWLETGHRPQDRVVFNHFIYDFLPHTRGENTRRLLTFFNNLPDRNNNWWILMPTGGRIGPAFAPLLRNASSSRRPAPRVDGHYHEARAQTGDARKECDMLRSHTGVPSGVCLKRTRLRK